MQQIFPALSIAISSTFTPLLMQLEMLFAERMAGNKEMFVSLMNHDAFRELAAGPYLSAGDGNGRGAGIAGDGWR